MNCSGHDLLRGIATAYEIQIDLVKSISLHKHKVDHIAHLCPAQAAGIGTLLNLPTEIIYQAIQQSVHVSFTTRQSRKGEIRQLEGIRACPRRQTRPLKPSIARCVARVRLARSTRGMTA